MYTYKGNMLPICLLLLIIIWLFSCSKIISKMTHMIIITNFDNDVGFRLEFCFLDLCSPLPLPTGTVYRHQINAHYIVLICSIKISNMYM